MRYIKTIKQRIALLVIISLLIPVFRVQSVSAIIDQKIPVIDNNERDEKAAVYWNPEDLRETSGLATSSNTGWPDKPATDSNVSEISSLATASDTADGLTPDTAVRNLDTAIRLAKKLNRQSEGDIQNTVIYAMNPLVIPPGVSYTVDGEGVSIVPWEERAGDENYIFIIEGGQLSLEHITLRRDDWLAVPEESALVHMSSGVMRLGEQAESYGTFVLDYTQAASSQRPVIELMSQFDFASYFRLDLQIPNDLEDDVTVINELYLDQITADELKEAFPSVNAEAGWELMVTEQNGGEVKSLIARRIKNCIGGRLWLDENADGVANSGEAGVAGYTVGLYRTDDLNTAIQNTVTKEDGTYRFYGMGAGSYTVGIAPEIVGQKQYLLPQTGITGDNKFGLSVIDSAEAAYSETIKFTEDFGTSAVNMDGGLQQYPARSRYARGQYVNWNFGGNLLFNHDDAKLVVMEADGELFAGYYKGYPANESGLRQALFDLYERNESAADYVMYLGSNLTDLSEDIFKNRKKATGTSDITFAALQGRVNILVLTGNRYDPITYVPTVSEPSDNRIISVSEKGERYFGCHMILRNIRHDFKADNSGTCGVYMNGYSLTLGGGSWQLNETCYFGGSKDGEIAPDGGSTSLMVYSTGNGNSYFIGGMRTGKLNGNAETEIRGTSGNIIHIYGGGMGTSQNPADITGSITNNITAMDYKNGGLGCFLGGVHYGNVGGPITNTISGKGRFNYEYNDNTGIIDKSCFIGGSLHGNIGSDATLGKTVDTSDLLGLEESNDYIIKNSVDTSSYTNGRGFYNGTNHESGIVKGNVINLVRAGKFNKGSLSAFSGGSSKLAQINGDWTNSFTIDEKTARITNVDKGLKAAKAAAQYQLYGNITTVIYSGSICSIDADDNYFRGAGWGYMKGNAYSEVGTEGVVYAEKYQYQYSSSINNQGVSTYLNMTGGGGSRNVYHNFCIEGDTALVTRNVLARWTYGGNYNGVQVGNSLRSHYGGVIDTCEGTGWGSYIHVGDGRSEVHGGQVDWYLCGGGWHDWYQDGNVSVEVYDAPDVYINASLGGTYGEGVSHYISGDSDIVVHGGNFTGTARTGPGNGFAAGPIYYGSIYGNASMTVDLRGNRHGFSIKSNDKICGGRGVDSLGGFLGTNMNNTITLNLLSDKVLTNDLNIYGDGANNPDNTKAGHIIINVNAPGSKIGNVYAMNYSNLDNGRLRKDVQINLVSAATITGLGTGNGTEDITDAAAAASADQCKKAVINVGPQSDCPDDILGDRENGPTSDGLPHRIRITKYGIIGFTKMNIRRRLLLAEEGKILNGSSASLDNHGSSYYQSGNLTLYAGKEMAGAGLGISANNNAGIIAGSMTVAGEGKAYIQSGGQKDQIVFTNIKTSADSALVWLKTGTVYADNHLKTNWFGVSQGWPVITINPDKSKADAITPVNFMGRDLATGRSYIGDSDTHWGNGYAVAIPGTVYEWEVTKGNGKISHNIPLSAEVPSAGQTISAYGTVSAGTPTLKGLLAVPRGLIPNTVPYPTFSFIPDSRFDNVECVDIYGSDRHLSANHSYHIGAGAYEQTQTWTAGGDDIWYGFNIEAQFDRLPVPPTIDITVSKQVEGDYANHTKEFTYTIYFADSNGTALASGTEFACRGSILPGSEADLPDYSVLTLDQEGSASFVLKHGQQIIITSPQPGKIRIVESADSHYSTYYWDSSTEVTTKGLDTGTISLMMDQRFDFTSTRNMVVPAGVWLGKQSGLLLLILSMLMLTGITSAARIHCRRRRR